MKLEEKRAQRNKHCQDGKSDECLSCEWYKTCAAEVEADWVHLNETWRDSSEKYAAWGERDRHDAGRL